MIWRNAKAARKRTSFTGCEAGVDYEATVKIYREQIKLAKRKHKARGQAEKTEESEARQEDGEEDEEKKKNSREKKVTKTKDLNLMRKKDQSSDRSSRVPSNQEKD